MENIEINENIKIASEIGEFAPLTEKNIFNNKDNYILLNENDMEAIDITNDIYKITEDFTNGQMDHTDDFNLEDTMNSVELNHYKMDSHFNYKEASTFKKLHREGKTLSLIDNLNTREVMWMYGLPIYQTIFSLVYFTDDSINKEKLEKDENVFRIYLDSSLQILYITYNAIRNCTCLRDEDLSMIPSYSSSNFMKREKIASDLKSCEVNLRTKMKAVDANSPDKKIISQLINRVRVRRELLRLLHEQFDFKNDKRYKNLATIVNSFKGLLAEQKSNLSQIQDNLKLTEDYFCDNLSRISPQIASLKQITYLNYHQAFEKLDKFVNNLSSISKIYELKDFAQIQGSIEKLNSEQPSFIIRSLLELNLFPKNSLLFGSIEYINVIHENLKEFKISFLSEDSDIITNLVIIDKEILIHNLRNRARQVRDSAALFDGLAMLVIEGNQAEKDFKKSNKVNKTILTNYLLKQIFHEMIQHIWISFEIELFSSWELDYIFYASEAIVTNLAQNTHIVAGRFAEKIIREENFVNSEAKKKLSLSQKMVLDELHIFDALKCALKGLALMCRWLKIAKLINNPQSFDPEIERLRVENRFPVFKNCRYFIDLTYENFLKDTNFDPIKDKDLIFQSADSYLKTAIKYLNEIKNADITLRDSFHYSNEYIENLSKAIIWNNLQLGKIKKMEKPGKLIINMNRYKTMLPCLEITI